MKAEQVKELIAANPALLLTDNTLMSKTRVDTNCVFVGYTDASGGTPKEIEVLIGGALPLNTYAEILYAFMVLRKLEKVIVWGAGHVYFHTRDFGAWCEYFPAFPKERLRKHLAGLEGDAAVFALVGRDDNEMELESMAIDLEEVELILEREK